MIYAPLRQFRTTPVCGVEPINWLNPITKGLIRVDYGTTSAAGTKDRKRRIAVCPRGSAYTEGSYSVEAQTASPLYGSEGTLFSIVYWGGVSYNQPIHSLHNAWSSYASNQIRILWSADWNGKVQFIVKVNGTTLMSTGNSASIIEGQPLALCGGPRGLRAFIGKSLVASNASTAWTKDFASDSYLAYGVQGENMGSSDLASKKMAISLAFNRQLSDEEIFSLNNNPWQVFL